MAETYGFTFSGVGFHRGFSCSTSGYSDPFRAKVDCYKNALEVGWRPEPLREHWWQFWRPRSWPQEIEVARKEWLEAMTPKG